MANIGENMAPDFEHPGENMGENMANMGENMVPDSVVYILGKIWHLILNILGGKYVN